MLVCIFLLANLFVTGLTLGSKSDSTLGRLFIWKNTIAAIQQRPFFGYGAGTFHSVYGKQQAFYFAQHGMQGKEAQLADSVYYAFNEWLHLAVEYGLPAALLLLLLHVLLLLIGVHRCRKQATSRCYKSIVLIFAGLLTASFISYPVYYLPTRFLYFIAVIYLLFVAAKFINKKIKRFAFTVLLFACSVVLYKNVKARLSWKHAITLNRFGRVHEATNLLLYARQTLPRNGDLLTVIAAAYEKTGMVDSALFFVRSALHYKYDAALLTLYGNLLFETGDFKRAEYLYLQAVLTTPNRFRSRELLIAHYIRTKQYPKAKLWAAETLAMPVKVTSEATIRSRNRIMQLYEQSIP